MTLLPGGREQISEEMINEIHGRWRHWATAPSRTMIRDALTAALALLPDEAAIRAAALTKAADLVGELVEAQRNTECVAALLVARHVILRARGSVTEDTR